MDEHDRPPGIVDHGRDRDHHRRRVSSISSRRNTDCPSGSRNATVVERENDRQRACVRIEHLAEHRRASLNRNRLAPGHLNFGGGRSACLRRLRFRNTTRYMNLGNIGHLEERGSGRHIRAGRRLTRRERARNRRAKDEEPARIRVAGTVARGVVLGDLRFGARAAAPAPALRSRGLRRGAFVATRQQRPGVPRARDRARQDRLRRPPRLAPVRAAAVHRAPKGGGSSRASSCPCVTALPGATGAT